MELASLIAEKRALSLKSLSKITSRPLSLKDLDTGEILKFSSINSATANLKDTNLKVDWNKIAKCLDSKTPYLGYTYIRG